jgi:hypothetical protein
MALGHAPSFAFDNILNFIDPFNPRCFDGTSATMIDLFSQTSAIGNSLASISSTQGISFGTNKNTFVATGTSFIDMSTSEYTKICWFNLDDVSSRQPLICGNNPRHYFWMNNTANLTMSHSGTRSAVAPTLSSTAGTTTLSTGIWYFGAATWRSIAAPGAAIGNTGGRVYLNGRLDAINPTMGLGFSSTGSSYHYGSVTDPTISSPVLNGKISYALIYRRVLSDQEILQIYNATKRRYGY